MTEIGNRIYPLGRDQRPNVCVRARVGAGGWQRKGGVACCSAPCRQGGLTTGIIDKKQNPVRLGAERGPLGFGVSLCLHILTASQAAASPWLKAKQARNRRGCNSTGNLPTSSGFFSSAGALPLTVRGSSVGKVFSGSPHACVCVIIDYSCIVWSWLTASDIFAYAWVCIWIPLFLMKQTHVHPNTHTHTQKCSSAMVLRRVLNCGDSLLFLTFCRYHCVEKQRCVWWGSWLTLDASLWCPNTYTHTLFQQQCSHLSVALNIFPTFFCPPWLVLLFQTPWLTPWVNLQYSLMDIIENGKHVSKTLLAQNTNIYQRTRGR